MTEPGTGMDPTAHMAKPRTAQPQEQASPEQQSVYGPPTGDWIPWADVYKKPEYKSQPPRVQSRIKQEYFDLVVAPRLPENEYTSKRGEFFNHTARLEIESEAPSFWRDVVWKTIEETPERTAGILLGAMNSPGSFIWGFGKGEELIDREKFNNMHWSEQFLVSMAARTKAGAASAAKSIFKKGDWGVRYGEYFESVTGQTIEQALPNGLKWMAPTLEFMAEVSVDPFMWGGAAMSLPSLQVPKNWIGKIPKKVADDIARLEAMDVADKKAVQDIITDMTSTRRDYEDFIVKQMETKKTLQAAQGDEIPGGLVGEIEVVKPKLRPDQRATVKEGKAALSKAEDAEASIGDPLLTPEGRGTSDLTAPQQAMAGQPKREFAEITERETLEIAKQIEEARVLGKLSDARSKPPPEVVAKEINAFRKAKGLGPGSKSYPIEKINELRRADTVEKLNAFNRKNGLSTIELKSTAGLVMGVEEDEDGTPRYNIAKGLLGAAGAAGGMSLFNAKRQQKFTQTLMDNPAWAKVHGTVGKISKEFSLTGMLSKVTKNVFDRFWALRGVSDATYKAARSHSAYIDEAGMKLGELKESMKDLKKDEVVFTDYVNASRLESRAKQGIKNPDGVTLKDAQQAKKEIEHFYDMNGGDVTKLRKGVADFKKWTHDYILKEALDSGVINKEAYNAMKDKFYATFEVLDRLPSDMNKIQSIPGGEHFSVAGQKVIQKMTGTSKKIADPLESTIKKFTEAQGLFARNKVANTFIDDPAIKEMIRPVAKSQKEFTALKSQGKNPIMEGAWDVKDFDTISRIKDGNVETYLTNKDIAEAMKGLSPYQAPKVVQALNNIFRKAATTTYLPFTISNAFRDAIMAYATSPVYKTKDLPKFLKDWGKGFKEGMKHEFGKSDIAEEYIKAGGGFGYTGELRRAGGIKTSLFEKGIADKTIDVIKSPVDLIEKISGGIELASRLAVFERAKILGIPKDDAALLARAATIDFNRAGTYTRALNQFTPFLSARVGARVTLAEALKANPKETLAKVFTSTVIPGMSTYALNRLYFSDQYDDIPEYIKQNYFTLITHMTTDEEGNETPSYIAIPKGDVGQMAWNPVEFALDNMLEKDPEGTKAFLVNYASDLSPVEFARRGELSLSKAMGSLLPPIVKGVAEDWANLSFYRGTEIVPYYMGKTKPPELQYKENTPETYKWLGEKLGVAPLRLQNFASNILAGYGREGLDPSAMIRGLTGRLVKTTSGAIEQQAWTIVKDIEQGYVYTRAFALEAAKKGDRQEAMRLLMQWNRGVEEQVDDFNEKFGKYGVVDKGGIRKSYSFTRRKISSLIRSARKRDKRSGLEKILSRRKR